MSKAINTVFPVIPPLDDRQLPIEFGLTKRELFAAMAMQGLCSVGHGWIGNADMPEVARRAVLMADNLLAELAKP